MNISSNSLKNRFWDIQPGRSFGQHGKHRSRHRANEDNEHRCDPKVEMGIGSSARSTVECIVGHYLADFVHEESDAAQAKKWYRRSA
jgi:hypothetical protein